MHPNSCGVTQTHSYDITYANPVTGATSYIFNVSNAGLGYNQTRTAWAGGRAIRLDQFPGIQLNTTYDVKVKVVIGPDTSAYGSVCQVTTAAISTPDPLPTTKLLNSQCGITLSTSSDVIYAIPVTGATSYIFNVSNAGLGYNQTRTAWAGGRSVRLRDFPGTQLNITYDVKVRVIIGPDTSAYGAICQVTNGSTLRISSSSINKSFKILDDIQINNLEMKIYPNPNQGEFIYLELNGLQTNSELVVFDVFGKIVLTQQIDTEGTTYNKTLRFNKKLDAGFYFVTVTSGNQKTTRKLIVQ